MRGAGVLGIGLILVAFLLAATAAAQVGTSAPPPQTPVQTAPSGATSTTEFGGGSRFEFVIPVAKTGDIKATITWAPPIRAEAEIMPPSGRIAAMLAHGMGSLRISGAAKDTAGVGDWKLRVLSKEGPIKGTLKVVWPGNEDGKVVWLGAPASDEVLSAALSGTIDRMRRWKSGGAPQNDAERATWQLLGANAGAAAAVRGIEENYTVRSELLSAAGPGTTGNGPNDWQYCRMCPIPPTEVMAAEPGEVKIGGIFRTRAADREPTPAPVHPPEITQAADVATLAYVDQAAALNRNKDLPAGLNSPRLFVMLHDVACRASTNNEPDGMDEVYVLIALNSANRLSVGESSLLTEMHASRSTYRMDTVLETLVDGEAVAGLSLVPFVLIEKDVESTEAARAYFTFMIADAFNQFSDILRQGGGIDTARKTYCAVLLNHAWLYNNLTPGEHDDMVHGGCMYLAQDDVRAMAERRESSRQASSINFVGGQFGSGYTVRFMLWGE